MLGTTLGIICHGGAGIIEDKPAAAAGLTEAIEEGYRLLRQSASCLEAVVTAVRIMEDNPLFNCGTGSNLTIDGVAEMDASVMTQDGRFGGVTGLVRVKNPVLVAHKVMTETDHLLLGGEGAVQFARKLGLAECDVVTERSRARLDKVLAEGSPYFPKLSRTTASQVASGTDDGHLGTVGAVAIDKRGNLAVATSSGGITGRMRGRVGDSAILGAGTYAAPSGAVTCTGHGEEIMRRLIAKDVVDRMMTMPASVALTLVISEARRRKIRLGAVGFDARAGICYGHTTPDMAWGYKVAERIFLFTEDKSPKPRPVSGV
jgi:beta-aspartyl-peptidase (threonine type)